MIKAFAAGIAHETNGFSPIPTDIKTVKEGFQYYDPSESPEPPKYMDLIGYATFVELCRDNDVEIYRSLMTQIMPSAPMTAETYNTLKQKILTDLKSVLPVDMVYLALHGAQYAEGCDDCEGDLIAAIRKLAGEKTCIGVMLDLHANVSARMLMECDMLVSCKEYPHIDYPERTHELFKLMLAVVRNEIRPCMAAYRLPAIGILPTTDDAVREYVNGLFSTEKIADVLFLSALHGFPMGDTPHTAGSVVVITDNQPRLADKLAREKADELLRLMLSKKQTGESIEQAFDEAEANEDGPVVIADRADNAGGGAAGDSTFLLAEILRRGMKNVATGMLWDPVAVETAHAVGEGNSFTFRVGGKMGPLSGNPVDIHATVTALRTDARQALFGRGPPGEKLGKSAAIHTNGVDIILNSIRQQVFSPHCFTEHGIDPGERNIVVVKSIQHFYAGFAPLAVRVIYCDAPGTTAFNLKHLPFRHIPRPLYPIDDITGTTSTKFYPLVN